RTTVINLSNLTSTSYTPTSNLALGRYEVTVTATNGSGTTTSNAYYFDVTQIALTSPVGAAFDTTPVFKWSAIPGASRYDIWVNQAQPTFINKVLRNEFVATNSYESPKTLGEGTYTWWVRAYDADGVVGEWSPGKAFSIDRVTFSSPAAVTLDTTPTITWTNLGAPRYELWVDQVGGTKKIIYKAALTTNTYTPTTPLPNGSYEVWVRPLAADGEAGLWSLKYSFQMDYRIGPAPVTPAGVTTDTTPTFTWKAIDGAANYDLWVDNLSTGQKQVIRRTVQQVNGATTISYTPTTPLAAGNYRWWVQAVNSAGGRTAWSAGTSFQVPVPSIFTPKGVQTTGTPQFTWSGVDEFKTYDLWVDNLTSGVKQVIRVTGLTNKFYTPTLPLEDGQFRAWVRGFDSAGRASQWSAFADFTIDASISNAPIPISPRIGTSDNTPTFTWQSVANATKYEILVKDISSNGQPTVLNVNSIVGSGTTISYTTTTTLAPNKTYRWWVRAITVNNQPGPWSQPLDFTVVSSEQTSPSDGVNSLDSVQLASVVLTAAAEHGIDDGFRSVSAHPAATVVQLTPEAMANFVTQSAAAVMDAAAPAAEIDAVMEELSLESLFMSDLDATTRTQPAVLIPATVVVSDNEQSSKLGTGEKIVAGLLAALVMPRALPRAVENRKQSR
ncbi:MAG: hypothetical protein R3C17_18550, partial [Planctomycetaceae bacterium]